MYKLIILTAIFLVSSCARERMYGCQDMCDTTSVKSYNDETSVCECTQMSEFCAK